MPVLFKARGGRPACGLDVYLSTDSALPTRYDFGIHAAEIHVALVLDIGFPGVGR